MPRNFWMIVCNEENFGISRDRGFTVQGLKAQYRRKVQRIEPGDRLMYYVSGIRCFTATATVTSGYEEDDAVIWRNEGNTGWPYRIGIKPEIVLDETQYIKAGLLAHRLDYVRRWPPENWYMAFQGNLHLLPKNDFFLIEEEMKKLKYGRDYSQEPVAPASKTKGKPRRHRTAAGQRDGPAGSSPVEDRSPSRSST